MFIKILFTIALFGCSFFASASLYNLDQVNPTIVSYTAFNQSINDQFTFTIPANSQGAAAAVALDISIGDVTLWGIKNLVVSADSTSPSPLSFTAKLDANTNAITGYLSNALNAGAYVFDVSGVTSGIYGGAYSAGFSTVQTSALTPVPVPAAIWLFGSAMLGLTGLNRRKLATA